MWAWHRPIAGEILKKIDRAVNFWRIFKVFSWSGDPISANQKAGKVAYLYFHNQPFNMGEILTTCSCMVEFCSFKKLKIFYDYFFYNSQVYKKHYFTIISETIR